MSDRPIYDVTVPMPEGTKVPVMSDAEKHREPILQFFEYGHLPDHLQEISAKFEPLARWMCEVLPRNPERIVALRKLLEAKDAAVRAALA